MSITILYKIKCILYIYLSYFVIKACILKYMFIHDKQIETCSIYFMLNNSLCWKHVKLYHNVPPTINTKVFTKHLGLRIRLVLFEF